MEKTFSKNLVEFRKKCGLTQSQLAVKLHVTPQAVSKWENGSFPDCEFIPKLAEILGVSIDALFGVKQETEKPELEELIFDSIHQTPAPERPDLLMKIFHSMMCAYQDFRRSRNKYPEELDLVTYDEIKTEYDMGIARLNDDMKFFCYMKRPEKGLNSYTEARDDVVRLFSMLADKDAINIIHFLASGSRNRLISLEVVSKNLGMPMEKVKKVIDKLDRFGIVWRVSAELPESSQIVYGFANNTLLFNILVCAKALCSFIQNTDVYVDTYSTGPCRMDNVADSSPVPQISWWNSDAD